MFIIFDMEDHRKVQLAAWLLKEEAAFWWEVTNATRPVETWADFRERFGLKFLSSAEENLQMESFLALKQGDILLFSVLHVRHLRLHKAYYPKLN